MRGRRLARSAAYLLTLSILAGPVVLDPPSAAETGRPPAPGRIPDIETFMQIGAAGTPALTRGGGTLFFTTSMTGTRQIYRLTKEGWPYQLTFFPNGIGSFNLSHDERTIAVTAEAGGSERYQVFLIDTETGALTQVTDEPEVRFAVPAFSADDRMLYFGANLDSPSDFHVYEQEIETGARRVLFRRDGWNSVTDTSADGRFLLIYRGTSSLNSDLYRLEIATGTDVLLTPHEGDVQYSAALFGKDPTVVYTITDDNPDGVPRLARISGNPPTRAWLFPNDPNPWSVESVVLSSDYKTLAWTTNEEGWGRLHLWDLAGNRALPFPQLDGIVSTPSVSEAGKVAVEFNSPLTAPDIWTWDAAIAGWGRWVMKGIKGGCDGKGGLRQRTFSSYAGIDPEWFTPPELIHYESFDGTSIPAFLYLPKGEQGGPIPFIVDVHGGPEGQFRPYFNRHFQYLLLHGYGILAPNVRGSSGYGRAYLDADNYKNRMASVKDLAWGVRYLIDRGLTTPSQVGVKGVSYGGYMTLAAMTEFPDLFAAGIDQVGIANFETYFENTASYRVDFRTSEYGPPEDVEFLRSISPIHKIDRIRGALFVVHGENDPRVPVSEARQILKGLVERGVPVDSLIFADEGHGISKLANRLVFYRRMVDFFDAHLKKNEATEPVVNQ